MSGGLTPSAVDVGKSIAMQDSWAERGSGSIKNLPSRLQPFLPEETFEQLGMTESGLPPTPTALVRAPQRHRTNRM